jgi:hypothetical protein
MCVGIGGKPEETLLGDFTLVITCYDMSREQYLYSMSES